MWYLFLKEKKGIVQCFPHVTSSLNTVWLYGNHCIYEIFIFVYYLVHKRGTSLSRVYPSFKTRFLWLLFKFSWVIINRTILLLWTTTEVIVDTTYVALYNYFNSCVTASTCLRSQKAYSSISPLTVPCSDMFNKFWSNQINCFSKHKTRRSFT